MERCFEQPLMVVQGLAYSEWVVYFEVLKYLKSLEVKQPERTEIISSVFAIEYGRIIAIEGKKIVFNTLRLSMINDHRHHAHALNITSDYMEQNTWRQTSLKTDFQESSIMRLGGHSSHCTSIDIKNDYIEKFKETKILKWLAPFSTWNSRAHREGVSVHGSYTQQGTWHQSGLNYSTTPLRWASTRCQHFNRGQGFPARRYPYYPAVR